MSIAVSKKTEGENTVPARGLDKRWWEEPDPRMAASKLAAWSDQIEQGMWTRRWFNLAAWRMMNGRPTPPTTYNYSAVARPSGAMIYSRAVFDAPRYNCLRQCSDALANRVYANIPLLQVVPIDTPEARGVAKKLTRWLDAAWHTYRIRQTFMDIADDARTWGAGFLRVYPGDGEIKLSRVLMDEILYDDNELNVEATPRRLALRIFANRQDLLAEYGADEEARAAIMRAPKSQNGFFFGGEIDCTDVVVLREAWSLATPAGPGVHMLSVGDYSFVHEEYARKHFPLARLTFRNMPGSWFGMGMPEMVLGLQRELDRVMGAMSENIRRAAWPRILIATGSNVNPGSLADISNGIVPYTNTPPQFVFPPAISKDQYQYYCDLVNKIKETFRLNDQLSAGIEPKQISGVAVSKIDEIDDAAHLELFKSLEAFTVDVGNLLIEAATVAEPEVIYPGRRMQRIKWSDVKATDDGYTLQTFDVGQLSQSISVRQQQIDAWYAAGKIDKETSLRLEQVPDLDAFQDEAAAGRDYVDHCLDRIVTDGKYETPEPFMDLSSALRVAESRYLIEKRSGSLPPARMNMLLRWMAQVQEMLAQATSPAPAGTPPAGIPTYAPSSPAPVAAAGMPVAGAPST